jgi:hypothetical protein
LEHLDDAVITNVNLEPCEMNALIADYVRVLSLATNKAISLLRYSFVNAI